MAFEGRVKIVVPGDQPIQIAGSPHLEKLKPYGDVVLFSDRPPSSVEKVKRAEDAEVILNTRGSVKWGEDEFQHLPKLKVISLCSIGTDMIDLVAARKRGITVCNLPGRTAPVVAEHIFGMMFALSKRAAFFTSAMKAGGWPRKEQRHAARQGARRDRHRCHRRGDGPPGPRDRHERSSLTPSTLRRNAEFAARALGGS